MGGARGGGRGERADSLSSRAASLCLAKGPLHPGGRIYVLVFYGSRAGHHGFGDKIFVNAKSLREGGEFRDLLPPPDQSKNHLLSPQRFAELLSISGTVSGCWRYSSEQGRSRFCPQGVRLLERKTCYAGKSDGGRLYQVHKKNHKRLRWQVTRRATLAELVRA